MEKVPQNCRDSKCTKIKEDETCGAYANPILKWTSGLCPLSPRPKVVKKEEKKVNPIKKSKRRE